MKVTFPEPQQCCCCVPLRYGLIAWGYIKLVYSLSLGVMDTRDVMDYGDLPVSYKTKLQTSHSVEKGTMLLLVIIDFCFVSLFIFAQHRKSVKLLHKYYIYSMVYLCIFTVSFIYNAAEILTFVSDFTNEKENAQDFLIFTLLGVFVGIFYVGIQVYIILVLRSEINKLKNNGYNTFMNEEINASELRTIIYPNESFAEGFEPDTKGSSNNLERCEPDSPFVEIDYPTCSGIIS